MWCTFFNKPLARIRVSTAKYKKGIGVQKEVRRTLILLLLLLQSSGQKCKEQEDFLDRYPLTIEIND